MRKNEIKIRMYSGLAISGKEAGRLERMGLKGLFWLTIARLQTKPNVMA